LIFPPNQHSKILPSFTRDSYPVCLEGSYWIDSTARNADAFAMPFPLDKIRRLGDYDAQWWLRLRCRCCRHARNVPASFFIERYGKQARIDVIAKRLFCANCRDKVCRCAARNFEARIGLPR
jgi:hypothetical protein